MAFLANQLPPEYDDFQPRNYDPQYTMKISMEMSVPDRIVAADDENEDDALDSSELNNISQMEMPDRIIVLGHDQSLGLKKEPRLHLDFTSTLLLEDNQLVNLSTPPRTLRLEDHNYPSLDDNFLNSSKINNRSIPNGKVSESEAQLIQTQLDKLSKQIALLEDDNTRRTRRELLLYPILFGFLFIHVAKMFIAMK